MDGEDLVRVGCYGREDEAGGLLVWGGRGGRKGGVQDWGEGGDEGREDGHGGGGVVVDGGGGRVELVEVMMGMPLCGGEMVEGRGDGVL